MRGENSENLDWSRPEACENMVAKVPHQHYWKLRERCTTESNTAHTVNSNRRLRSQGVCGKMAVVQRRTCRRPNCGIHQTEKQDSCKEMGFQGDHGFIIDATIEPHHHVYSLQQHLDSGRVRVGIHVHRSTERCQERSSRRDESRSTKATVGYGTTRE